MLLTERPKRPDLLDLQSCPPTHTDLNGESVHGHPSLSATRTREGEDGAMVWDQGPHGMPEPQYIPSKTWAEHLQGPGPSKWAQTCLSLRPSLYRLHVQASTAQEMQVCLS